MNQELYSQEAVQQIIKRASAIQAQEQVSTGQLELIAAEVGISPEALALAEAQWRADQAHAARQWADALLTQEALRGHFVAWAAASLVLGLNIHYAQLNPDLWMIPALWSGGWLWHRRAFRTRSSKRV